MTSYALTKALGEVHEPDHLTIRTSIIGPEIRQSGIGLFNWFMKQRGEISGYRAVKWNGVTTLELAKAIEFFMNKDVGGLSIWGIRILSANTSCCYCSRTYGENRRDGGAYRRICSRSDTSQHAA